MHFFSLTYTQTNKPQLRIIAVIIALFFSTSVYSQLVPPPFEIRDDTSWQVEIPEQYVLYFYDSTGKLTQEQVNELFKQGKMKAWRNNQSKRRSGDHYWFYYRVNNAMGRPIESALDSYANISDFYISRSNGKKEFHTTGDMQSWKKKEEFFQNNISPFKLDSNETVEIFYHANFKNDRFILNPFKIALANPGSYARRELKQKEPNSFTARTTSSAFYSGIFLLAALIYLVFFFLVREKVFLYFALFLIGLFISATHFLVELQRYYPPIVKFTAIGSTGSFGVFLLFIREFLNTRKYQPKWDKFLLAFALIFLLGVIYNAATDPTQSSVWFPLIFGSIFVVMIITFFLLGHEQKKEKKFLLYAILPTLVAFPSLIIIVTVVMLSDNPDTLMNNSILQTAGDTLNNLIDVSFLWMILSFSRLLFRRFSEQRQKIQQQELEKEQIMRQQELERMKMVEHQKLELEKKVTERTAELKKSLEELKATQNQLIQSEKMASLGEMTAGIAHEIQNPLNFVNNFAEVNNEITAEIKAEIEKLIPGDKRADLNTLLDDLAGNQEKIRFHGKRADSIVKNMLMHSRKGIAQKEPVNLNALVDEYTKLSYHGLRARDKSFNSDFDIQLDPSIITVDLLQQDFGRVLLNLVNNAFYAVQEKTKIAGSDYKPSVMVKTSRVKDAVRIEVNDNGDGINEQIKDKIFQPFFTTKPTGEGTGLGLSISYEIITKGHNGKMWVETKEGEGSSFIVEIPA